MGEADVKRERGYYWVRTTDVDDGDWIVAEWNQGSWWVIACGDRRFQDIDFAEIDERRLEQKRERGYYWVRKRDVHDGDWIVAEWDLGSWWLIACGDRRFQDIDFAEIDERRLEHKQAIHHTVFGSFS